MMVKRYYKPSFHPDMEVEINRMIRTIQEKFGVRLTKVQASRLIAVKSRNSSIIIDHKRLLEIIGR